MVSIRAFILGDVQGLAVRTTVGFRAHVKVASRIVSFRIVSYGQVRESDILDNIFREGRAGSRK